MRRQIIPSAQGTPGYHGDYREVGGQGKLSLFRPDADNTPRRTVKPGSGTTRLAREGTLPTARVHE